MNLPQDRTEIHVSGSVAMAVPRRHRVLLLVCGGLAVLQYTRFAEAAAKVEHTHRGPRLHRPRRRAAGRRGNRPPRLPPHEEPRLPAAVPRACGRQTRALLSRLDELVVDNPTQRDRSRRLATLAESQARRDGARPRAERRRRSRRARDRAHRRRRGQTGDGRRRAVAAEMRAAEGSLLVQRAEPGTPGSTRRPRLRDRQPARRHRAGPASRCRWTATSSAGESRSSEEMAARVAAEREADGRGRGPAAERELQSQHPRQLGRLHPGSRTRRPRGADESSGPRAHGNRRRRTPLAGPAMDVALERRRRARAAGDRRRDRQGRRTIPRVSPDRQGHAEVVGRHRDAHSRRGRHTCRSW